MNIVCHHIEHITTYEANGKKINAKLIRPTGSKNQFTESAGQNILNGNGRWHKSKIKRAEKSLRTKHVISIHKLQENEARRKIYIKKRNGDIEHN